MNVLVACGSRRETDTPRKADARHLGALGALEVDCLECGGDGDWGKFIANNDELLYELTGLLSYVPGTVPCVQCKGTGKVYVGG